MESSKGNPSIHSVILVADALGVGVESILDARHSEDVKIIRRSALPSKELDSGNYNSLKLFDGLCTQLVAEHVHLKPGAKSVCVNGVRGQRRVLYCCDGSINFTSKDEQGVLNAGDLLDMPSNQECVVFNESTEPSTGILMIRA